MIEHNRWTGPSVAADVETTAVAPRPACWGMWFDEEDARRWLGTARFLMPEQEGAPFAWAFAHGERVHHYAGRVLALDRPRELRLLWHLTSLPIDTEVTVTIQEPSVGTSSVRIRHEGFPDSPLGRVERDLFAHHWEHHLALFSARASGTDGALGHPVQLGIVPLGVDRALGLVVKDVIDGTPAASAGLCPGDIVRAIGGTRLESMEDFDAWLDRQSPGERVVVELLDRAVEVRTAAGVRYGVTSASEGGTTGEA